MDLSDERVQIIQNIHPVVFGIKQEFYNKTILTQYGYAEC